MAAIAASVQPAAAPLPSPPPIVQPAPPVYPPVYPPANEPAYTRGERIVEPSLNPPLRQQRQRPDTYQDYRADEAEPKDSVMKLTQLVIVGAAIALIGFFAWRMFLQPRPVTAPDLAATASVTGVAGQQVTQISPPQLRRVVVATQALATPDLAGPVIGQLPVGSTLDVSGQITVNGINWLRVSLPNDSSRSGFVREDQMANLGDGTLSIAPLEQVPGALPPGTIAPGAAAVEVVGPVQARDPATFYIASVQANIRQEANVTSTKVGTFEFTDPVTVVAQRTVGARTWYQIQLPSGGMGWINGRLVSAAPRDIPIDAATPKDAQKPPASTPSSDTGKADDQAALTALGPGANVRVDSSIANVRKEPGATGNSVVEVLQRDTLMSVEDVRIVNGIPWYRVTSPNGAQGWISGRTVVENK